MWPWCSASAGKGCTVPRCSTGWSLCGFGTFAAAGSLKPLKFASDASSSTASEIFSKQVTVSIKTKDMAVTWQILKRLSSSRRKADARNDFRSSLAALKFAIQWSTSGGRVISWMADPSSFKNLPDSVLIRVNGSWTLPQILSGFCMNKSTVIVSKRCHIDKVIL